MSTVPPALADAVAALLGSGVRVQEAVPGGCINQAARLRAADADWFLKWRSSPPAGFFEAEADGLRRLAATGTVNVPRDVSVGRAGPEGFVLMRWVTPCAAAEREPAMRDAARRLAQLHARRGLSPGLATDNWIGTLRQLNHAGEGARWVPWFVERRLLPLAAALPSELRRALERVAWDRELTEPEGGCALLHGDLWAGNLVCGVGGAGWLVDPAVYAGHPEVDLAMTRLFGGFSQGFYAAYQEEAGGFDAGIEARLDLLNLYPLLVHVHLFGGGYVAQVKAVLDRHA